jgi:NhaC family Na+:H+ antiporter
MDILLGFFILFVLLIISALKGIFAGYALMIGLGIFIYIGTKHGYPIYNLLKMSFEGGKKSLIILQIFVLIGAIIAIWMASGTIPAIVFYGIELIYPQLFILSAFLVTCVVSLLIGTSLGTTGTIGIAVMIIARSGDVYLPLVAGAVMSGAYFGDRNSPMSSSANLVAQISKTNLYDNIINMIKTSLLPFSISVILYGILSYFYPITTTSTILSQGIENNFHISLWVLLPAICIILLSFFKVNVKLSMLISIIIALVISLGIQKYSFLENIKYIIFGFKMEQSSPIADVLQGGGIISMMKTGVIVFISSAFTGVFEGTDLLKGIIKKLVKKKNRQGVFIQTIFVSIASSIIGCTQTLAVMLTHILTKETYDINNLSKEEIAIDLENSAIMLAPMIPWNIAALVPLTTMGVGPKALLFSFYLILLPFLYWITLSIKDRLNKKIPSDDLAVNGHNTQ